MTPKEKAYDKEYREKNKEKLALDARMRHRRNYKSVKKQQEEDEPQTQADIDKEIKAHFNNPRSQPYVPACVWAGPIKRKDSFWS